MIRFNNILTYSKKYLRGLSEKGMYTILLLYYAYKDGRTPTWAKRIIIGAFAYLVSPIDGIPDFTPIIGMTDDLGVLTFGLVTIACYINKDVREKALEKMSTLFPGGINNNDIKEINKYL